VQEGLFDKADKPRRVALMRTVDQLNLRLGREMVCFAAAGARRVIYSLSKAERVDGGYRFFGHRHFGSLTPVWTWLNTYGADLANPNGPRIIHAVMPRDGSGYRIVETWDTLGVRATGGLIGIFVTMRHMRHPSAIKRQPEMVLARPPPVRQSPV
jgi:Domain of unknown function (DUF4113)